MPGLADLFAGSNFRGTIQRYCNANGWRIADLNDRRAILRFDMNSGRTQTLYIIKYESTLEFSVPSMLAFDSPDKLPHFISSLLLERNSENKIGFWCIETIGNKKVYSYMHNAEMSLLDANFFGRVVTALIKECDTLEGIVLDMMRR